MSHIVIRRVESYWVRRVELAILGNGHQEG